MPTSTSRTQDATVCHEHVAGVIQAPSRDVLVDGRNIAANGDPCPCQNGAPSVILAGATDVLVAGIPVAGVQHATSHNTAPPLTPNSFVAVGTPMVLLGGGTTVGNVAAALAACAAAAFGRGGGRTTQSGQNCGLECIRQIVNQHNAYYGKPEVSESELLKSSLRNGQTYIVRNKTDQWDVTLIEKDEQLRRADEKVKGLQALVDNKSDDPARQKQYEAELREAKKERDRTREEVSVDQKSGALIGGPTEIHQQAEEARQRQAELRQRALDNPDWKGAEWGNAGGTRYAQEQEILYDNDIASRSVGQTAEDRAEIQRAVAEGKGVIVGCDAGTLWGDKGKVGAGHAVLVTGVEYAEDGTVSGYVTNDPAKGCGRRVSADTMHAALDPTQRAVITHAPIWNYPQKS